MSPIHGAAASDEPQQLSLLHGFPASAATAAGPALAARLPVAQVRLESSLPHLDRPFDYSVPAGLDTAAQPGVRVKVKFNGQELAGYLIDRVAESDAGHPLVPLHKVVSPVPVLTGAVAELAGRVAARYAGSVSDVLRVAVPPRMAKLEKDLAPDGVLDPSLFADEGAEAGAGAAIPAGLESSSWSSYRNGPAFLQHLNAGESPRAVLSALQGYGPGGWPRLIAEAVAAVRLSGRGAVVVVPDYRDLDRVEAALLQLLPAGDVARLTADDGQTPRYRSFLRILSGAAGVAVGTRSAAYAPVQQPRARGLLGRRRRSAHRAALTVRPLPRGPAAARRAGGRRLPARRAHPEHRNAAPRRGRVGAAGGGRPRRRPPDRSAGAEHRRQLRTRTRSAGQDRPAAGRRLACRQGRTGTRPGPGPGGAGGLRAVAGVRKLP